MQRGALSGIPSDSLSSRVNFSFRAAIERERAQIKRGRKTTRKGEWERVAVHDAAPTGHSVLDTPEDCKREHPILFV